MWTEADRRIGIGSAAAVALLGLIYVVTGLVGVASRPAGLPLLAQVDPYLAMLEVLIILSAIALVTLMSAVCAFASPKTRTSARAALAFTTAFALLTCATHFAALTLGRQVPAAQAPELIAQLSFTWPTVSLALDLLAWDLLLGLALVFAAPVFSGRGLAAAARWTLYAAGLLCLAGLAGPLSGRMDFQFAAIAGYAFVMPAGCVLVGCVFGRSPAAD